MSEPTTTEQQQQAQSSGETPAVLLERASASSIELARDAKGVYRYSVKLYFETDEHDFALDRLHFIDAALRATYCDDVDDLADKLAASLAAKDGES